MKINVPFEKLRTLIFLLFLPSIVPFLFFYFFFSNERSKMRGRSAGEETKKDHRVLKLVFQLKIRK